MIYDDIRLAIQREFPNIMRRAPFSSAQARTMLRVEVERPKLAEFFSGLDPWDAKFIMEHINGRKPGPFTMEGVAVYDVAALPEPGWRIINPMEAK